MDSLEGLLKDLLEYAEEGLSIDEAMANRIRFFLEVETGKDVRPKGKTPLKAGDFGVPLEEADFI